MDNLTPMAQADPSMMAKLASMFGMGAAKPAPAPGQLPDTALASAMPPVDGGVSGEQVMTTEQPQTPGMMEALQGILQFFANKKKQGNELPANRYGALGNAESSGAMRDNAAAADEGYTQ